MLPRSRELLRGGPLQKARRNRAARDPGDWNRAELELIKSCFLKQRWLLEDTARRIVAKVPRGGGKTTTILGRGARRLKRTRRAKFLYIATSRTQGEILIWEPLKNLNEKMKLGLVFNETKMTARLPRTGGTFRVVGADDKREIEKLRGQPFHEVWIDEAASHPASILEALILRIIGPRLGDFGGTLGMIGTPGHILAGMFYEATGPGLLDREQRPYSRPYADREHPDFAGWDRWSLHTWTLPENTKAGHEERHCPPGCQIPHMWEEALEEKRRQGWSDNHPIWRREYLAEWAADDTENVFKYRPFLDDGAPWNQWDPVRTPLGFGVLPSGHEWDYVYGADMGHSDPFALEIFAYSPTHPKLHHVYEFQRTGMHPKQVGELHLGEEAVRRILAGETGVEPDPKSVIGVTGYPAGAEADIAGSGQMVLDELSKVYGVTYTAAPRNPNDKHAAIELFNGDLVDGRVVILKGSHLEKQLQANQWDRQENGTLKERAGQPNNATDAAVYARRKANHLIQAYRETPKANPGTPERVNQDADDSLRRMTEKADRRMQAERESLLDDGEDWTALLGK